MDWIGERSSASSARFQPGPRRLDEPVDDDLPGRAGQDDDVAAGTGEHRQPVGELGRLDRRGANLSTRGVGRVALECLEQAARRIPDQEHAAGQQASRMQEHPAG
jgi:hypothetical protein